MEPKDKVFWVALGGSVLAGFYFLGGHVHETTAAEPPPTAGPDDGDPDEREKVPEVPAPTPEMPGYDDVDERTALARVIRSEAGSHTSEERLAVAWVVKNRAKRRGTTIRRMVCWPRCGKQGRERPFSSRSAPRATDLALADTVLASAPALDPTRGAWDAFEPALQDKLVAQKHPGYTKTAAQVRKDWLEGSDFYGTVGRWELYGPKRRKTQPPKQTPASKPATVAPAVATEPRLPKYGPHNV